MTGGAGGGKTGEYCIPMAAVAGQVGMSAGEREFAVVERGRRPTIRGMAGLTGSAKLPFVLVVLGVAGVTIGWRAFEKSIDMTTSAWHAAMFTG